MQHKEELLDQKKNKQEPEEVKDENQVQRKKNIIVEIGTVTMKAHHHKVFLWKSMLIIFFNNHTHHNYIHNNSKLIMENIKMNYLHN